MQSHHRELAGGSLETEAWLSSSFRWPHELKSGTFWSRTYPAFLMHCENYIGAPTQRETGPGRLWDDGVSMFFAREEAKGQASVAVIIPAYNMAWCLERAIASCRVQTYPPTEIIVVDDGSLDHTSEIVGSVETRDQRVRCLRLDPNVGHLSALRHGLRSSTSDWAVLLDADDELTKNSIECRLRAAERYHQKTGEWPQLVYGDLHRNGTGPGTITRFKSLEGRAFGFLSRELSLCQTCTIMLGREAIRRLPDVTNPYNTDDELVLAVGKHFPVAHAGEPVAIAYDHASPTRMSNSALRRLRGIAWLVWNHGGEIVREHGSGRLFLWWLRVLRAFVEWQIEWAERSSGTHTGAGMRESILWWPVRLYGKLARSVHDRVTSYLKLRFEQMYF